MTDHAVAIAGGGPTGMVLGAELTMAGVDCLIVEPRPTPELESSRAGGLNARTLEVLDQRGVVDRFLAEGRPMQIHRFAGAALDIGDLPTRHGYGLALWQRDAERIMAGWIAELGVPMVRAVAVTGAEQDADGVDVALSDGRTLRAQYLVGCDGGRSVVRKAAGIAFPGTEATQSWLIAEADTAEAPPIGVRREGGGIGPLARDGSTRGPYGIVILDAEVVTEGEPTLDDVRAALVRVHGRDFGVHSPTYVSRFTDATRQAASYRADRILLAGDAAHINPPQGGQGLNTGVQDAVNLGWKLALVATGRAPDALLDTYHDERHPVAGRAQRLTTATLAAMTGDDRHDALRAELADVVAMDEPRRHLAGLLSGLAIRYDLGGEHPLVGRRAPDLDLTTDDGPTSVFALLHAARPLLLVLDGATSVDAGAWADRVTTVVARADAPWALPDGGEVGAPAAVLVRPDGHVAWVETSGDDGLAAALERWFGPAMP